MSCLSAGTMPHAGLLDAPRVLDNVGGGIRVQEVS
jgi:hypothetical protein